MIIIWILACTQPNRARATLENAGFTDIRTGSHDFFACSKDDWTSTHFTATNALGKRVEGTVCCGALKGCTIRF